MEAFIALTSGMTLAMVTEAEILSPNGVLPYKTLTQLYTMGGMYQLVLAYDKTAYCAEHMTRLARKLDKLFVNADENITMGELLERAENEE